MTTYRLYYGILTTEHAQSSHNIPVLLVDGIAYGPADLVPGLPNEDIFGPTTAADLVRTWGNGTRTEDERAAADRYLSQWPAGPQLTGVIMR